MSVGMEMYRLAERLFPICRSLTGDGVRDTLKILKEKNDDLCIQEISTGTNAFDWIVPKEWNIRDGYIKDPQGEKILDFHRSNLHIMSYSIPVHGTVKKDELLKYIYTEPGQPDVIPYITSYYKERFGFCMTESQKLKILYDYPDDALFEICIDSTLDDGWLTYGEIVMPPPAPYTALEKTTKKYFSQHISVILRLQTMNYRVLVWQYTWQIG